MELNFAPEQIVPTDIDVDHMLYLAVHFTWAKLKHLACDLNIYARLNHEDDRWIGAWIKAWIKEYVIVNKSPIGHSCTFRKLIHMEKVKVMKIF